MLEDPTPLTEQGEIDETSSLLDRYQKAPLALSIEQLLEVQRQISFLALFSSNESLDDLSTKSIPFLSIDYYLALAYFNIPTASPEERKSNLLLGINSLSQILQLLEDYEILNDEKTKREFHNLLQLDMLDEENNQKELLRLSATPREDKIERLKTKKSLKQQATQFESLKERRLRLGISNEEIMDGYDEESLERTLELRIIAVHALEALDEWKQALREIPMLIMQLRIGLERQQQKESSMPQQPTSHSKQPPLKLTHITKSQTGQFQIRKEEIRSKVFQPGWNQPTMSLDEFAQKEVEAAIQRQEQSDIAAEINKLAPKRYDELVRDGLEDNVDLVDASAKLDRDWDDWKDQNPRGCGNKMGDRGDRNF
mmetsp:Transcript_18888/g.21640  ORF Transcript_18888/g.21640 Transcript_18888/m.21640 type:complete len:370 (+) Transcript_18888:107-1216(+)|eukprot:CAMPEP_0194158154 /NCGR_PEP_ID=MMETSP0152-20130528/74943_1 /TAXON_ID=1049557 /ORGANISM="Thalassiothrix antarctica, Strain L6-D1" /LENGTH=369 /DNA_ID=CAMNT_0038867169 /DNA_START=48 /DNA_END=1157 /DNA_ORIENTATION=+